jgi:hypothetical protein
MTIQDEINTRTLQTVKQAETFAVDTLKSVGERVQPVLPKIDGLRGIERFPTVTEVVEKAFDLTSELLKSARKVAVEATKAFALRDGKTAKPAAKKTTVAATATADAAS